MDIILASGSPRRARWLRRFGVPLSYCFKQSNGQPQPPGLNG